MASDETRPLTSWEKFVSLARKVVQTPKVEMDKREKEWRARRRRRTAKE